MESTIAWEYRDYVYKLPSRSGVNLGSEFLSNLNEVFILRRSGREPTKPASEKAPFSQISFAREIFWRENRERIQDDLQHWLIDGWEPADRVRSNCIAIRIRRQFPGPPAARAILMVLVVLLVGLPLAWRCSFAEPTEFRLALRRPKR